MNPHLGIAAPRMDSIPIPAPVLEVGARCAVAEKNRTGVDLSGFDVTLLNHALRVFPLYSGLIQNEIDKRGPPPGARTATAAMQAISDIRAADTDSVFSAIPQIPLLKDLEKLTQADLGRLLGKGGNKQIFEMPLWPGQVVAVGRSRAQMQKELDGLKALKKAGVPALDVEDRIVMLGTQPCLILQKVDDAANTKGKDREFNKRLNQTSIEDLERMKAAIEANGLRIGDFQIMVDGVTGHAWVHDPDYVIEGSGKIDSEISLVNECIERARRQIALAQAMKGLLA